MSIVCGVLNYLERLDEMLENFLYHGTYLQNLKSILNQGIRPDRRVDAYSDGTDIEKVSFSRSPDVASKFGSYGFMGKSSDQVTVVVSRLDLNRSHKIHVYNAHGKNRKGSEYNHWSGYELEEYVTKTVPVDMIRAFITPSSTMLKVQKVLGQRRDGTPVFTPEDWRRFP